jgi:Ca2+-binding RTX toxin-like protein
MHTWAFLEVAAWHATVGKRALKGIAKSKTTARKTREPLLLRSDTWKEGGSWVRRWIALSAAIVVVTGIRMVIPVSAAPACTVPGTAEDNVLYGTGGADVICGRAGRDVLIGRRGNDELRGGLDGDLLFPGRGSDTVRGYRGQDVLSYLNVPYTVTVKANERRVYEGGGIIDTFHGIEEIVGSDGDDLMFGYHGDDRFQGQGGGDILSGRGGTDYLYGRVGNDYLNGGRGSDQLSGFWGDDELVTRDGTGGNDSAFGGPGEDRCVIDAGDLARHCEHVIVR